MGAQIADAAYAAGFFDGEGSVYSASRGQGSRKSPTILVCIGNTDLDVLRWHQSMWGGSIQERPNTKPRHRVQHQWVLAPRMAAVFLSDIAPYLRIKAEVVSVALRALEMMRRPAADRIDYTGRKWDGVRWWSAPRVRPEFMAESDALYAQIRQLNARGFNALRVYA
jgi:hypothetical protein